MPWGSRIRRNAGSCARVLRNSYTRILGEPDMAPAVDTREIERVHRRPALVPDADGAIAVCADVEVLHVRATVGTRVAEGVRPIEASKPPEPAPGMHDCLLPLHQVH